GVGACGFPPFGAFGLFSQLSLGRVARCLVRCNLICATTGGGSAGHCTVLINVLYVGRSIGASPLKQLIAQKLGILVGSIVGVLSY
ncbi:OPT/YSL family transporter, partial [Pseudomonas syringae group genomosp. 7]|uniref:OPT/YSL family transporter n=1 Tax=Pseudomonas syringae group genomosp. 7 TaxID=251699 RepID=UPI00376F55F6